MINQRKKRNHYLRAWLKGRVQRYRSIDNHWWFLILFLVVAYILKQWFFNFSMTSSLYLPKSTQYPHDKINGCFIDIRKQIHLNPQQNMANRPQTQEALLKSQTHISLKYTK